MAVKTLQASVSGDRSPVISSRLPVALALVAVYVIWGSTYLGLRIAVESFPPLLVTGFRFFIAGILMFGWLALRGTALPSKRQIRNAVITGCLMLGVGTGGVAVAEQWVASGLAATAVAVVPIWAALWAGLWGKFPSKLEWGGLALGMIGVVLLNMDNGMQGNSLGALILLIAPVSWAFGSMWSRRVSMPTGLMTPAVQMMGGGAALMLAGVLAGEIGQLATKQPTLEGVVSVIYLITFGSIVAFSAYAYLLRTVRPVIATSYAYVNPVVAVLLGALFASETITPIGIAAMIVILAGVGVLGFASQSKK
jgi:drug/metabolite transporter (DMT)-like permease